MIFLYDLGIWLYGVAVRLASIRNAKAKAWLIGRKNILQKIEKEINPHVRYTWFHFASLGEFEQGRSVLELLKAKQKDISILVTFFSPSGYTVRKDYPLADHIFYLPADTAVNAHQFINLVQPVRAIFTKYEYWYHYFNELNKRQIPLYLISGIFRKKQPFFRFYGSLHRKMLRCVSHFFVQNVESKVLLQSLSLNNVTVNGDTRFDRVVQNALRPKVFEAIKIFCGHSKVLVAGSTWSEDEKLLIDLIKTYPDWKLIIAPHEINEGGIAFLEQLFDKKAIRYSLFSTQPNSVCSVLIIDNIGMLSSLYQYGHVVYIGGGFGAGIHNTLEAAAFGLPVLFGPHYHKFQEAKDLIQSGAAFSVKNLSELELIFNKLLEPCYLACCGEAAKTYVNKHIGATEVIVDYVLKY